MRSFLLSHQARFLVAIPVVCLFIALYDDSTGSPQAPSREPTPTMQPDTDLESLPDEPSNISTQDLGSTLEELIQREQEDARAELAQIRREIDDLDQESSGAFRNTLAHVLSSPFLSRPMSDDKYRLPAGAGMDALVAYLPPVRNLQEEQEQWSLMAVVALITSSQPGQEIQNYLDLNSSRPVRQFLFPD